MNRTTITTITLIAASVLVVAECVAAGTITLRRAVRLPSDAETIRLKDIATIEGEKAEAFADLVIAEPDDPGEAVEISVRQVRDALSDADVHWGKVHLNGRRVVVRPSRSGHAKPPVAMQTASVSASSRSSGNRDDRGSRRNRTTIEAAKIIEQDTLAGEIARMVVGELEYPADDVRIVFNDGDRDLLEQRTDELRFELRPMSNIHADRVELAVRMWKDGRTRDQQSLTIRPQVRTETLTARRNIRRHESVADIDVERESLWLSPIQARRAADSDDAFGQLATRTISEGDRIRADLLRGPSVVERGDRVIVRCLVGNTVISVEAEAREDGAMNESIEFRKIGERETFSAEVVGPAEAIKEVQR